MPPVYVGSKLSWLQGRLESWICILQVDVAQPEILGLHISLPTVQSLSRITTFIASMFVA